MGSGAAALNREKDINDAHSSIVRGGFTQNFDTCCRPICIIFEYEIPRVVSEAVGGVVLEGVCRHRSDTYLSAVREAC